MTEAVRPRTSADSLSADTDRSARMGVEEEFHLVDVVTRQLVAQAPELLQRLPAVTFSAELQCSVVESGSEVATTLSDLRADLVGTRAVLVAAADEMGLAPVAAGTVPLLDPAVLTITGTDRFQRMSDDYQLLVREQLICGTQVHIEVPDPDVCVAVAQRVGPWLPTLLALSASSPYWGGADSGYASARSLAWQRWPTTGGGGVTTAAQHDQLVRDLVASGTISDPAMIYFDVRPSAHLPTLELRVTDACADIEDVVLLAALFRALVRRESDAVLSGLGPDLTAAPLLRAAMWRAARSGLEGELVSLTAQPEPKQAAVVVHELLGHARPHLEAAGDWAEVSELVDRALRSGSCAAAQRRAYGRRGQLTDVVDLLVDRTRGAPAAVTVIPEASLLHRYGAERYDARPPEAELTGDEAIGPDGRARPAYVDLLAHVEGLGASGLQACERARDEQQREHGVTFTLTGESGARLFPVDLLPRIVGAQEWTVLRHGLEQRARALDAFLHDVYGERAAVHDGVVPAWVVDGSPGLAPIGALLHRQAVRAHVSGMDLVHEVGRGWFVLEDNLRIPSGIGYALANRQLTESVLPGVTVPAGLLPVDGVAGQLRAVLEQAAPPATADAGASLLVLSEGPGDSAWFEHRSLAAQMGVPVGMPSELTVRDGEVWLMRAGLTRRIDVIYLRVGEDTLLHATGADGHPLGPALIQAVDRGTITLANAPGNGVADDKALYAYVPALISYYLGEKPLLADVPTYLGGVPEQCRLILDRLHELVAKPVDGYGGEGVLIGPHATAEQLAVTRRQVLAAPARWIAQEVVALSTAPVFDGRSLAPRHVDLRAFVLTGEQTTTLPVALTRVAPAGGLIVNSSRGGGSKDTWLLGEPSSLPVGPTGTAAW